MGVPVLGLDAVASTAYGPEAALTILAAAGAGGLHYFPVITLWMIILLVALYLSYRQTAAAYPDGGGAYTVAKENLGYRMAVMAGTALIIDYVLNVAVAISAGVAAVLSAIPILHQHRLALCLVVLFTLTLINLRGVKQSGVVFSLPVLTFVVCVGIALSIGIMQALLSGGHPNAVR